MNWDEHAAGWNDNQAVRAYSRAALDSLLAFSSQNPIALKNARVLDFGCGTGLLTAGLAQKCAHIVALDTSQKMTEVLRNKIEQRSLDNVTVINQAIEAAAANNPALQQPFDLIVCSSVCAFLEDYPKTVQLLTGLLQPGGWFMQWDWELDTDSEEAFGLSREHIHTTLSTAGLKSVQVETAFEIDVEGETMRPLLGAGRSPLR